MKKYQFRVLFKNERNNMMDNRVVTVLEQDAEKAMHLANAIVMGMLGAGFMYLRTRLL